MPAHTISQYLRTIQSHFNVGAMKEVPVPVPPIADQKKLVHHLQAEADLVSALVSKLHNQIAFLREHRQALITASVTGELLAPGVAA